MASAVERTCEEYAGRVEGPVVFWHTGGGPSLFAAGWGDELV